MAMNSQALDNQPWYRHFWPWFLFGLPALSVVLCTSLFFIANHWNVNSIVAGDYSKDGRGVEIRTERFRYAQNLGLSAHATVREDMISIKVSAADEKDLPEVLRLAIIHPTQDRFDQHVLLQKGEGGVYSGPIKLLHASRWRFQLENESREWRMTGDAYVPTETEVSIKPFQSG